METTNNKDQHVFLDKITLSAQILDKEGTMVGYFSTLASKRRQHYITDENIQESSDYCQCWATLHELYDFMRYNKILDYSNKNKGNKELINQLNTIIDNYLQPNKKIGFNELEQAKNIMHGVVSFCGYHDDSRKEKGASLFDEDD